MTVNRSLNFHIALIGFFILVVYYPSIFAPFTSIDDLRMISHLLNYDNFTLKGVFFPGSSGTYYRPLLSLTFISDKYLWGLEASFMHLENILLHAGNSLLVFFLARHLLAALSIEVVLPPLIAALLFGLHPIATEPVNWISGRTDLLSGFFVFAALLFFLRSIRFLSFLYALFGALLFLAGCLSKETALFLLPVILLWTVSQPKDSCTTSTSFLRCFLFGIFSTAGVCYLLLRWVALSSGDKIAKTVNNVGTALHNESSLGLYTIIDTVLKTAGFYFKKLIMPLPLNFGIDKISPHYFWLGLVVFAAVIWCLYRRDTVSYLFIAAFMLTSSAFILPLLKITWTPIAERYVYIAAAPFIIGVTLVFIKYVNYLVSSRLMTLFISILLCGATVVTAQRNIVWQDNYTLYKDTMEKSPGFGAITNEYAIALRERGQNDEADKIMLTNKVDEFQQSSLNRIRVLTSNGQLVEARSLLMERIDKGAEYKLVLLELLLAIDESRRSKAKLKKEQHVIDLEILSTMQKLLEFTGDPFYHYRIGKLHLTLNKRVAAKDSFTKAWQGANLNSHYRESARKLSERL